MGQEASTLRAMIERLSRLAAAEDRIGDLNPAQAQALGYLARANRFSRAPSHVADYLGATRGTVSQTLKALIRKGLLEVHRDPEDRRRIRYDLSAEGARRITRNREAEAALDRLGVSERAALERGVRAALGALVEVRGGPSFGICGVCKHLETAGPSRTCRLFGEKLAAPEAAQICHSQAPKT